MAALYGIDPGKIRETVITIDDALQRAVPLDTSLNTRKATSILKTKFRNV